VLCVYLYYKSVHGQWFEVKLTHEVRCLKAWYYEGNDDINRVQVSYNVPPQELRPHPHFEVILADRLPEVDVVMIDDNEVGRCC